MPFKRVEANPDQTYELEERHGPWIIMAASFAAGGEAEQRATAEQQAHDWIDPSGKVCLVEYTIPKAWCGKKVAELNEPGTFWLTAITRLGAAEVVGSGAFGQEGDVLQFVADVNAQFGLHIDEESYNTLGGYVLGRLGRRARVGDRLDVEGRTLRVEALDGLRVARVYLSKERAAT